ncbi:MULTISPECIES: muropeptide MFS transporter AmpG [Providencia]|uniref:Anhydromuropeptide permease n=5 Tax=Gammaproteobacteria TaxID=1236 RepID=A0AA42FNK2_9GAMM|nr:MULTISPECIES: muropeptide MFS transporter AmpG [Providencia]HCI97846.1 muropeptide transporter AmpG [Providencia sp.]APC10459.1 muropeptide transporter [Providencia rettgeri]AVL74078.1 muropeptide transporter AmpG [Providencia rettgeri]EIL1982352.1 muropeptide MFS transporter AmpG [Providencia rettgeri]EIU9515301.1 muropeptide MFS transporter AmpG [Providencia rettgeri]
MPRFTLPNNITLILLGFVSGLPLALTAGTLQAWLTVENVDIRTIGFFSLVGQAYVLKFLWSPMMDRYTPPFLGRRRGWLLTTQILLIISIAAMGFMNPSEHLWYLAALAVTVAFCSASQDIVFDAYKTDLLSAEERGIGAATSVMGYRISMLVSGGLALWLADKFLTWKQLYLLMAGLMVIGVIATLLAKEPEEDTAPPTSLKKAIYEPLAEFFSRNNAWLILLLLVFYKLGDAFVMALNTNFLLNALGFSLSEVGTVNKTVGMAATIIGALLGGYLMKNMSLFKALFLFGLLQGGSNIGYWFLAITPPHILTMGSIIFLENIFSGMGTAAFVALLMTLCNKSLSATQFALLSALSAVGRVYIGPIASIFVSNYGWPLFYLISIGVAVPGVLLLLACRTSLVYTQTTGLFQRRELYAKGYRFAVYALITAVSFLSIWLLSLLVFSFSGMKLYLFTTQIEFWLALPSYQNLIFNTGISIGAISLIIGGSLDFLAVRKTSQS